MGISLGEQTQIRERCPLILFQLGVDLILIHFIIILKGMEDMVLDIHINLGPMSIIFTLTAAIIKIIFIGIFIHTLGFTHGITLQNIIMVQNQAFLTIVKIKFNLDHLLVTLPLEGEKSLVTLK